MLVNALNGYREQFDKANKNNVFQEGRGQSGMEKVRPQINNTKQVKETHTTVPKMMLTQSQSKFRC